MTTNHENNDRNYETEKKKLESVSTQPIDDGRKEPRSLAQEETRPNNASNINLEMPSNSWQIDKKINIADAIGAFIAIIALIFLGYQSCELQKTNEIATESLRLAKESFIDAQKSGEENTLRAERATKAIEKSAEAMSIQAEATKEAVVDARKNIELTAFYAKIGNRAYISIKDVTPKVFQADKKFEVVIQFTNVGKTPAYEINIVRGMKFGGTGIYEHEMNEVKEMEVPKDQALGASIDFNSPINTEEIINQERFDKIISGRQVWYVYGKCSYRDIFGKSHFTRFCFRFVPNKDISKSSFVTYDKYNDAN